MVIQRGSGESWGLPSETRTPLQHQLIVTSLQGANDSSELHPQFTFRHQAVSQCQISKSPSLSPANNEKMVAVSVPQLCNSFTMPPMKEIKLEPQEYTEWKNTFDLRQANLAAITGNLCIPGTNSSTTWRGKFGPERGIGGPVDAARSLDLLRQNLQTIINQEIDLVISRYLQKYFHPAIENIKDNLGPESVTQDMLRKVCRQVLEDAKLMYAPLPNAYDASDSQNLWKSTHIKTERSRSHKVNASKIVKKEAVGIHQISVTEEPLLKTNNQNVQSSKRKSQVHKYNSSDHECSKKKQKCGIASSSKVTATFSSKTSSTSLTRIIHTSSCSQGNEQQQSHPHAPRVVSPSITSNHAAVICNTLSKMKSKDVALSGTCPRWDSAKWEASRIMSQTLFVMGARANKALGFGQMRGRLYIKHPELFKYSGDQEDKEWLTRNHLMPPTGGKAYLMIVEDIRELAETEEYKNNPNLLLDEIHGFVAPDFMLKKIRCYVNNLKMEGSNVFHPAISGRNTPMIKAKGQNKLPKLLPPPAVETVISQSAAEERKILPAKVQEQKIKELPYPLKSILETKLREEKSQALVPVSCMSSPISTTSSIPTTSSVPTTSSISTTSVSSSTAENKITLKSLLESKTSFHIGEKRLSDKL